MPPWRLLLAWAWLLAAASTLAAQTLPVPAVPRAETPDPDSALETPAAAGAPRAGPEVVTAPAPPPPWEYAIGAGVSWESDIQFPNPQGPSRLSLVPQGGVARVFRRPHAGLRATAAGRWNGSRGQTEARRSYADVTLDGSYESSPATGWTASASHGFGYSDSAGILREQGVFVPLMKVRSFMGALGVNHRIGSRGQVRAGGRFQSVGFDSPRFIDGQSFRGGIGLEHEIGRRTTAELGYAVEGVRAAETGRSYVTHFGSVQWTRVLSARTAVLLETGASYTPDALQADLESKGGFFGGLSVNRQVKRSNATLFLRREVTPAFGSGVSRLATRAGLRATVAMGRDWQVRLSGLHVRPDRQRHAATADPASEEMYAAVGRRFGRRLELSAEARYRRGASLPLPVMEAFEAGMFVTLLTTSGRAILPGPGR